MYTYYFTIDENETGFHIYGKPYWYLGKKIIPFYQTCQTKDDCYKWLEENFKNHYQVID